MGARAQTTLLGRIPELKINRTKKTRKKTRPLETPEQRMIPLLQTPVMMRKKTKGIRGRTGETRKIRRTRRETRNEERPIKKLIKKRRQKNPLQKARAIRRRREVKSTRARSEASR